MPYGNQSATTGSKSPVRRVNMPYDLGALDARQLLIMRGRLGAVRAMATSGIEVAPRMPHGITPASLRYPHMQALNRVPPEGFARTPFATGAIGIRDFYAMRGRLGEPLTMRSSRYASRTGAPDSRARSPIAGRYVVNGGRRLGQVTEIATAATSLTPAIASISQLFGPGASGADAERQAHVYSLYEQAMTAPGSPSSIDAVVNLYTTATQQYDPIARVQQNNPQITRTYAQQALQLLSSQGWINVNSLNPQYSGIGASGVVYAPTSATGMNTEAAVSQAPLPAGNRAALGTAVAVGVSPLLLFGVLGLGAVLLLRHA